MARDGEVEKQGRKDPSLLPDPRALEGLDRMEEESRTEAATAFLFSWGTVTRPCPLLRRGRKAGWVPSYFPRG